MAGTPTSSSATACSPSSGRRSATRTTRRGGSPPRAVAAARGIGEVLQGGPLRVGIGVNSGRAVVGTIGGGGRRDFTVIGDAVNTAARVEAATRLTGGDGPITQ